MHNQHRDYSQDASQLGFEIVGRYDTGVFTVDRSVRPIGAVYVWMLEVDGVTVPVRVGETGRMGPRFSSYNGWLGGRKWPGERRNAREQEKSRLTRLRLGDTAQVIAVPVPDKATGLAVERVLLDLWEPVLDLNFELPNSWARARMREWAAAYDLGKLK